MKRLLALLLCLSTAVFALASCQSKPQDSNDEITAPPTEQEPPTEENEMWNVGYIGSFTNTEYPGAFNLNEKTYSYTEVIQLGKAGTKVSFDVAIDLADSAAVLTVSSWKLMDGEWTLDRDGANVECGSDLVYTKTGGTTASYSYISTHGNECIRFCVRLGNPETVKVEYPEITLTETEEAGTLADYFVTKDWAIADRERAEYEILYGKKINFIGDSLFAGHSLGKENVWPSLLGKKYNMDYINYGISGCTLSACEGGANPIIKRYDKMADNDADIIIFEGGRNDYNKCAELGTAADGDITTYRGAVAKLIEGLREKYPNAVIIGVSFWKASNRQNGAGIDCNTYTAAMLDVCAELGVPCIDATDEEASGIRMTDKEFRREYSLQAGDVCHLNADGMKLALRFFEQQIAEIYSAEIAEK